MSKKQLQKHIVQTGGMTFNHGSHLMGDLLSAAYDLLDEYNIQSKGLKEGIGKVIGYNGDQRSAQTAAYYGDLGIKDPDLAAYFWHEDVFNLFNDLAPKGYYFGTLEGDGACFGFFQCQE